MSSTLTVDDRCYDERDLLGGVCPDDASANTREALDFCQAWLRGDPTFPITTSGSTGQPKRLELTRAQMTASARATAAALELRPGMTSLVCLPTRYVAGRMMLVRGLVLGLAMTLVEPAANPLQTIAATTTWDFLALIPLQMHSILDGSAEHRSQLDRATAILIGGAPIGENLLQSIQQLHAPVYHTYGMTETATHVALRRINGARPQRSFHALPDVQFAQDDLGRLAVRGAMTNGEWIQTNDVVTLGEANDFEWLGRADNVINSGGVKVLVEPIEAALEPFLAALPPPDDGAPRRYFVFGDVDERLGQVVTLVLEGPPLPVAQEQNLLTELRSRMGPFKAPRALLYRPHFVETPTGKVDREKSLTGGV